MEQYKELAKELIEEHITERQEYLASEKAKDDSWHVDTRKEILEALLDDTEDVFGNMTGSRTCNTYEAEQFISSSNAVFDEDIIGLYDELGDDYMAATLKRGAEVFDVVTLELVAPQVISEMMEL